jgi:hypothetical protein
MIDEKKRYRILLLITLIINIPGMIGIFIIDSKILIGISLILNILFLGLFVFFSYIDPKIKRND